MDEFRFHPGNVQTADRDQRLITDEEIQEAQRQDGTDGPPLIGRRVSEPHQLSAERISAGSEMICNLCLTPLISISRDIWPSATMTAKDRVESRNLL